MIEATLRAVFSLAVVLLLMWGLARLVRRGPGGRGLSSLAVLSRQQLSRGASVAVVKVDDRALVLGVTDAQVTYLTEAPLAAFERSAPFSAVLADHVGDVLSSGPEDRAPVSPAPADPDRPRPVRARPARGARHAARESAPGPLAGSVLSPATWSQVAGFVRTLPPKFGASRQR